MYVCYFSAGVVLLLVRARVCLSAHRCVDLQTVFQVLCQLSLVTTVPYGIYTFSFSRDHANVPVSAVAVTCAGAAMFNIKVQAISSHNQLPCATQNITRRKKSHEHALRSRPPRHSQRVTHQSRSATPLLSGVHHVYAACQLPICAVAQRRPPPGACRGGGGGVRGMVGMVGYTGFVVARARG